MVFTLYPSSPSPCHINHATKNNREYTPNWYCIAVCVALGCNRHLLNRMPHDIAYERILYSPITKLPYTNIASLAAQFSNRGFSYFLLAHRHFLCLKRFSCIYCYVRFSVHLTRCVLVGASVNSCVWKTKHMSTCVYSTYIPIPYTE